MNGQPHVHDFQFGGRSLMRGYLITYGNTTMRATRSERSIEKAMRRAVAKHDAGSIAAQEKQIIAERARESRQQVMLRVMEKVKADLIDPVVEKVEVKKKVTLSRYHHQMYGDEIIPPRVASRVTRFPSEKEVVATP